MITFENATNGNANMIIFPNSTEENIGYFTNERVDRTTIPNEWNLYEFRTNDGGQRSTLEPVVRVNFGGSFLTKNQISFPDENDKYRNIKGKHRKIK